MESGAQSHPVRIALETSGHGEEAVGPRSVGAPHVRCVVVDSFLHGRLQHLVYCVHSLTSFFLLFTHHFIVEQVVLLVVVRGQ